MDIVNHQLLMTSNMLGTMFFACTIYITLVIARYATLAKLIRDSRSNIETNKLKFKSIVLYTFHTLTSLNGRMAERLKAPVLKTGKGATLSWVRIPVLPPFNLTPIFNKVKL